jgi:hypothetical protein
MAKIEGANALDRLVRNQTLVAQANAAYGRKRAQARRTDSDRRPGHGREVALTVSMPVTP